MPLETPEQLRAARQPSNASHANRFFAMLGFHIAANYSQAGFRQLIVRFLRDYKNNFLHQMSRTNGILGTTISIQLLRPQFNRWRGARIGHDVSVGEDAVIGLTNPQHIAIGDGCHISAGVRLIEHGRNLKGYRPGVAMLDLVLYDKPIVIEDGCHIGVGAIILPGVTIGRGSIVGAGAVVRESVAPYSLVIGNPARVVKVFGATNPDEPAIGSQDDT